MMIPAELIREIQFRLPDYRFALQSLTFTPLGIDVQGNKGWIGLFGSFQPAKSLSLRCAYGCRGN
ncbi:MAG: hypothetical protein ACLS6O_00970 [Bifidobacterium sp.]